jgi:hypothetical protein
LKKKLRIWLGGTALAEHEQVSSITSTPKLNKIKTQNCTGFRTRGMTQVVEHLPSKHKALNSNSITGKWYGR